MSHGNSPAPEPGCVRKLAYQCPFETASQRTRLARLRRRHMSPLSSTTMALVAQTQPDGSPTVHGNPMPSRISAMSRVMELCISPRQASMTWMQGCKLRQRQATRVLTAPPHLRFIAWAEAVLHGSWMGNHTPVRTPLVQYDQRPEMRRCTKCHMSAMTQPLSLHGPRQRGLRASTLVMKICTGGTKGWGWMHQRSWVAVVVVAPTLSQVFATAHHRWGMNALPGESMRTSLRSRRTRRITSATSTAISQHQRRQRRRPCRHEWCIGHHQRLSRGGRKEWAWSQHHQLRLFLITTCGEVISAATFVQQVL
eukprot:m.419214 g.419214  ORF g.419214 m.419214 type:complete len:310 (-) comp21302_c0_seq3:1057-1986(-)